MKQLRRLVYALVCALALATPAEACGGLFCSRVPVDQAGEKILFMTDGEDVTAYVQIQYQGSAKDFSWVVPVPTQPTVSLGSDALFVALRNVTRPQFTLALTTEGSCDAGPLLGQAAGSTSLLQPQTAPGSSVNVVEQGQVGAFDKAIIQSNDPAALKKWLTDNDYDVPAKLDPLLDPYVAGKYYFVALKLQKDRDVGEIQPIVMKYKSTKPGIPIRLTGVAATQDMDVYTWVLGDHRAIPENYRHAIINEARIDWLNQGQNYRSVVTDAMNESGGQAWVTDFAGDSSAVDVSGFSTDKFKNVDELATLTDPVAFVEAVRRGGYFNAPVANNPGGFVFSINAQALAFFKHYVPLPKALKDQVDERAFYANISSYGTATRKSLTTVDAPAAVKELKETVIGPYQEIHTMFAAHPYLTALYTTMSPDEMTQDPMFIFNLDLPKVSNVHEAKGVRRCGPGVSFSDAPIEITLASGLRYAVQPNLQFGSAGGNRPLVMPAAAQVEQLKAAGMASLIQQNGPAIERSLGVVRGVSGAIGTTVVGFDQNGQLVAAPTSSQTARGFGCAGCAATNSAPNPSAQGEGMAYALVFVGFFGYRRWTGRSRKR